MDEKLKLVEIQIKNMERRLENEMDTLKRYAADVQECTEKGDLTWLLSNIKSLQDKAHEVRELQKQIQQVTEVYNFLTDKE